MTENFHSRGAEATCIEVSHGPPTGFIGITRKALKDYRTNQRVEEYHRFL